nr:chromophore lyase CpcT/CpeT [Hyphomonas sp. Mor2]
MTLKYIAVASALALAACAISHAEPSDLEAQLDELLTWFPGTYENHQQVYAQAIADLPASERHRHRHHTFAPVSISGLPGRLIYAQQYQHYDPQDLYRQRIYAFTVNEAEQAIQLTIYTPTDPSRLTDMHLDPARQAALSMDDFFLKPGCEVFWQKQGDQYEGYLKQNTCSYYSERFQTDVFLNETLIMRQDALLLDDFAVDGEGNQVFGSAGNGPSINLKYETCD